MDIEHNAAHLTVSSTPELSALAASEERSSFLVMSSLVAPEFRADKRAPVDMICVIDRSGSMSGDRIEMAKATVEFVVENLQREDRLGIVTYDDYVANHFPLTVMTPEGKEAATAAVKRIAVGGSTNLCGGLLEGIDQMRNREGEKKNDVASVLLFTDGQANVGYVSAEDIIKATINAQFASATGTNAGPMRRGGYGGPTPFSNITHYPPPQPQQQQQQFYQPQQQQQQQFYPPQQQQQQVPRSSRMPVPQQQPMMMSPQMAVPVAVQAQNPPDFSGTGGSASDVDEEKKKKNAGGEDVPLPCTINTFGFGADHDAALLKKIADHGQGMYYFIESTKSISEAFADCLAGLLSVVGQDIKVTFEVPAGSTGVTINRVVTKFRCTEIQAGRAYELSLGDIQSEERRDILIDVTVPATGVVESAVPILKTTVTYANVITGQQGSTVSHTATINRPASPTGEARQYDVDKQVNRLLAAEAMEQSNETARNGDLEAARQILRRASDRIKESVSREDDFCKGLVTDLQRCEGGLTSHSSYAAGGSKMLANQMQAHYVQRSSNVAWQGQQAYQSSARGQMQAAFNAKFH